MIWRHSARGVTAAAKVFSDHWRNARIQSGQRSPAAIRGRRPGGNGWTLPGTDRSLRRSPGPLSELRLWLSAETGRPGPEHWLLEGGQWQRAFPVSADGLAGQVAALLKLPADA